MSGVGFFALIMFVSYWLNILRKTKWDFDKLIDAFSDQNRTQKVLTVFFLFFSLVGHTFFYDVMSMYDETALTLQFVTLVLLFAGFMMSRQRNKDK